MSLVVTLGLDAESFARLDTLRREWFPPARNIVPAHISLFHQLPEPVESFLRDIAIATPSFTVRFTGLRRLSGGCAINIESPELLSFHRALAEPMRDWLTPQDRAPYHPHATIMNKATPEAAIEAMRVLGESWRPWEGRAESLLVWRYVGGPWEPVAEIKLAPRAT